MAYYNANEIMKLIENKDSIKNDFFDAVNGATDMIRDRYISKVTEVINEHERHIKENPSKEVQLLRSLKLFSNENTHRNIDNLIQCCMKVEIVKSIERELNESFEQPSGKFRSDNNYLGNYALQNNLKNSTLFMVMSALMRK